jgi:hypothetical protein
MAQSAGLHEPEDRLTPATIDRHRAIVSIQEELEAIDWYDQRVEAATDDDLKAVLDRHLRTYLFQEGSILAIEAKAESGSADGPSRSLGIGSLRSDTQEGGTPGT